MQNLFSAPTLCRLRRLKAAALALGLLGAANAGAQSLPTVIYGLGATSGAPQLFRLNPQNVNQTPVGDIYTSFTAITGLGAGQQLLGIDVRPATGQLYALAYNAGTGIAQLYILDPTSGALTAVNNGATVALNLQDTNRTNTTGIVTNVGFDFNPRVDRIRVVAPNGTNYRLNPNTGGLAATDGTLAFTAASNVSHAPYVGAAAYTNSTPVGVAGTTLYDLDLTAISTTNPGGGLLAIQTMPNDGTLAKQADLSFYTLQSSSTAGNLVYDPPLTQPGYRLTSPQHRLDLDIYYAPSSTVGTPGTNRAYLLESRLRNTGTGYSMNLYEFDLATGRAVGENIFGTANTIIYDIAAAAAFSKVWTGATSTDWATGSNWAPAGVPTTSDNVLILGTGTTVQTAGGAVVVGPQPIVASRNSTTTGGTTYGPQNANFLTLGNNALLTLSNDAVLNVYGDFVNNDSNLAGDATAAQGGSGTLVLASSSTAQEISGNVTTTFPNLQVVTTAATTASTSPVSIRRALTVSGTLTLGSTFTLLSSAAGTAYLVNSGSGRVNGTATVQRYITPTNPGPGYRHYSTPVSGNAVSDFAVTGVFTPSASDGYNSAPNPRQFQPYPNVFTYDQSRLATSNAGYAVGDFDNGFRSPASTATLLTPGLGYSVNINGGALVDFQGSLNQNANYPVSGLTRGAQVAAGYQLLGNPYPSAVNYDQVAGNSVGMESALYVYRSSGQYTGTYSTYVPPGPTNGGPGVSNGGGTNNLPVGRGFFVRTAPGQTGSVTFSAAARLNTPETAAFQRTAAETRPTLSLTLGNASIANQMRVYFDRSATSAFDARFDAHYLPATHGLDLASDISTEALAINGLPELTGTVTVPLRVHTLTAGIYTLAVDELTNLPTGYRAYLRDGSTGTYTDLTTTPSISLTLAPADAATGRYAVVFATAQPLANAPAVLAALVGVYPNPAHGTATLVLPQALRGQAASEVLVVNALGQAVLRRTVAAGSPEAVELSLSGLAAGIYTVRATTATGAVAKQLRVE